MTLELREIKNQQVRVKRGLSPEVLNPEGPGEYKIADTVLLDLIVSKDGSKYRLVGRIDANLRVDCGRCLEPFQMAVGIDVDLLYLPFSDNSGESDFRIEESDLRAAYYRDEEIDLGQLVTEQLRLALPMKLLCRDECQGLCSVCGGNRNQHLCQCAEDWNDPRLTGLKRLLER